MVQSQIGSNRRMHLTSSTCVTGQRRQLFWRPWFWSSESLSERNAALSKNLFHKENINRTISYFSVRTLISFWLRESSFLRIEYLLESICVKDLSVAIGGALLGIKIIQVFSVLWQADLPLLKRRNKNLAKAGKWVASRLEMPVPRSPEKKQYKCRKGRSTRHPKPKGPHSFILKVSQNGVGEEGAKVQSQVEVAKKGHFWESLLWVLFIKLVSPKCSNVWLVASISKGNEVDREVK